MTNRNAADPHTCFRDARAAAHYAATAWDAAIVAIQHVQAGAADWDASEAWVEACLTSEAAGKASRACKDLLDAEAAHQCEAANTHKHAARMAAAKTGAVIP